jgi:hypothetical protein
MHATQGRRSLGESHPSRRVHSKPVDYHHVCPSSLATNGIKNGLRKVWVVTVTRNTQHSRGFINDYNVIVFKCHFEILISKKTAKQEE